MGEKKSLAGFLEAEGLSGGAMFRWMAQEAKPQEMARLWNRAAPISQMMLAGMSTEVVKVILPTIMMYVEEKAAYKDREELWYWIVENLMPTNEYKVWYLIDKMRGRLTSVEKFLQTLMQYQDPDHPRWGVEGWCGGDMNAPAATSTTTGAVAEVEEDEDGDGDTDEDDED